MFIKNYADTDFVIKYKGGEKTLCAHDVTYIDENWITFPMVYAMFGHYVGLVNQDTPIEEFLFDNQVLATPKRIYTIVGKGPGAPRIFIKGGKATLYFADLLPEKIEEMFPSPAFTDIEGAMMIDFLTNYIAVDAEEDVKVIFTNIKVV